MKSLYKTMADINKRAEKYFLNIQSYAKDIKDMLQERFPDIRVLIFGSAIRGDYHPGSDIDIIIISSQMPQELFAQGKIKLEIKERFPDSPFELHLITSEQFDSWYQKFLKNEYIEV